MIGSMNSDAARGYPSIQKLLEMFTRSSKKFNPELPWAGFAVLFVWFGSSPRRGVAGHAVLFFPSELFLRLRGARCLQSAVPCHSCLLVAVLNVGSHLSVPLGGSPGPLAQVKYVNCFDGHSQAVRFTDVFRATFLPLIGSPGSIICGAAPSALPAKAEFILTTPFPRM